MRIEDTDRERSSEEHTKVILDGLTWLGLDWDEELVFQGAQLQQHQAAADRLRESGKVYEDEGAIRFKMPDEEIAWDDAIHGRISFAGSDIKDFIILRSDRTPTYNFSVVCDDTEMRITHVIRGDDHISNTPKQIALYRALDLDPPVFGHVPMIHGADGKRLSKRHDAIAVGDYRNRGILANAMRNFLSLLGWSPGDDRELFFTTDELLDAFTLEGIQKKSAIFDSKKLEWMNGQHLSKTPAESLVPLVDDHLLELGVEVTGSGRDKVLRCIDVVKERSRTTFQVAKQVAERLTRLEMKSDDIDPKAKKLFDKDRNRFNEALVASSERLRQLDEAAWEDSNLLETELRGLAESTGMKAGEVFQPIRIALTGSTVSEPVTQLICLVGKEETLHRLEWARTELFPPSA